jgi:putative nucleotidyltransferase with HDIG domain
MMIKETDQNASMPMSRFANVRMAEYEITSRLIYYTKLQTPQEELAESLAKILGSRDPQLAAHSFGVANFAAKLARRLGLDEERVDLIRRGSLLHDIGKLCVSQEILSSCTTLTRDEYEKIKTHPSLGAALLKECPEYLELIPMVRQHHEYFNGQGYPDGIAGNQIVIEARILAVAEAVTAMSTDYPYRKAYSHEQIIIELSKQSGRQFDPRIVTLAIQLLTGNKKMKRFSLKNQLFRH